MSIRNGTRAQDKFTCLDVAKAAKLKTGRTSGLEVLFHCPNPRHKHGDRKPSLSINPQKNVWLCGPCGESGTAWQLASFISGVAASDRTGLLGWLRERGLVSDGTPRPKPTKRNGRPIQCWYAYHNADGSIAYEMARSEYQLKGEREKEFAVYCKGSWGLKDKGVEPVLYRLPEVQRAVDIFICEGEKDVDSLRRTGATATTSPFGAKAWRDRYADCFLPKHHVVILPDNDADGRTYAETVAASLEGKVASVRIVELPGLPDKGDVSDWLKGQDLEAAGEALFRLVEATPDWAGPIPARSSADTGCDPNVMRFTKLGELLDEAEEEKRWLLEDRLPMGGDSLLVAKPKVGKSTLARCLALAVARGENFLGSKTAQGSVFYLALEEKRAEVRRHFRAMGATKDDPIFIFCASSPADGLEQLRKAMKDENPVLVIVDPLFRFVRVKDGNDYATMTAAMEPLHSLARDSGGHVMATHHAGKGIEKQGVDPSLGSTAIPAAVDTMFHMKRHDSYRTLASIQRYGPDLEEIVLEYNSQTRTISAGVPRIEADQNDAAKLIMEFLKDKTEPVDESAIQDAVEGRRWHKLKALRKLLAGGQLHRTGTGKKGDRFRYQLLYKTTGYQNPGNPAEPLPPQKNAGTAITEHERVPAFLAQKTGLNPALDSKNAGTQLFEENPPEPVPAKNQEPAKREDIEL